MSYIQTLTLMMKFLSLIYISTLFIMCALSANTVTQDPFKHIQSQNGIEEYELKSNGLKILLYPNDSTPVATVMLTYKVGSRNEVKGVTGATHILEHMMFKGTTNYSLESKMDYSSQMERIGARSNATTSHDRTNYYATLPKEHIELAIQLEADRMRNLHLTDQALASEMTVVRNEFERRENNPTETLYKKLFETAYQKHPYHHPIIGWKSDIESISVDKLSAFYDTYYWPNNAVLTIIGAYNKEAVLKSIAMHFGKIPSSPKPIPTLTTQEPSQAIERHVEVRRAGGVGAVMLANKLPHGLHKDFADILLLGEILGANKVGRLYGVLEDKGLASNSFAFSIRLKDPGLFVLGAFLNDGIAHDLVESILIESVEKIIQEGINTQELERARSVYLNGQIFAKDGTYLIADQINDAIALGDWRDYHTLTESIKTVTIQSIQAVAKKYLKASTRTIARYIPETKTDTTHDLEGALRPNHYQSPKLNNSHSTQTERASAVSFSPYIKETQVSGISITSLKLPIEQVVSFVGSIACGDNKSPNNSPLLASLTAAMLDQGTHNKDRAEITQLQDSLGIKLTFNTTSQALEFSGHFLAKDTETFLESLADQLKNPAFDPEIFQQIKKRYQSYLIQSENDTDFMAENILLQNLYDPAHPNHPSDIETLKQSIDSITVSDLNNFHREHYGKKSLKFVFAGAVDESQIQSSIQSLLGDWKLGSDYTNTRFSPRESKETTFNHFMPDKTSVSIRIAQRTGLRRSDPDYLPFSLANYILGGTSNARLMETVREEKGLTYAIYSYHSGDILSDGHWMLEATFSPSLLQEGIQATQAVLNEWASKGVSEAEVQASIETLKGRYLVGLSQTGMVARQVHSFLQRGFSPYYIDQYPSLLEAIRAEQVNESIQKYFKPKQLVTLTSGTSSGIQN